MDELLKDIIELLTRDKLYCIENGMNQAAGLYASAINIIRYGGESYIENRRM